MTGSNYPHQQNTILFEMVEDLIGQAGQEQSLDEILSLETGLIGEYYTIYREYSKQFHELDVATQKYFKVMNAEYATKEEKQEATQAAHKNFETYQKDFYDNFITRNHIFKEQLVLLFQRYNLNVPSDIAKITKEPINSLQDNIGLQHAYYCLAHANLQFNWDHDDNLIPRLSDRLDNITADIENLYVTLESCGFSLAYAKHAELASIDYADRKKLWIAGAKHGNLSCQIELVIDYLGYIENEVTKAPPEFPEPFEFPEQYDEDKIFAWIENIKHNGSLKGLARLQLFFGNTISMLRGIHQVADDEQASLSSNQISPQQRDALLKLTEFAKKISGDLTLNQKFDSMLQLNAKNTKWKKEATAIVENTEKYLEKQYGAPYKPTPLKIDKIFFQEQLDYMQYGLVYERSALCNTKPMDEKLTELFDHLIIKIERRRRKLAISSTDEQLLNMAIETDSDINHFFNKISQRYSGAPVLKRLFTAITFNLSKLVARIRGRQVASDRFGRTAASKLTAHFTSLQNLIKPNKLKDISNIKQENSSDAPHAKGIEKRNR